MTINNSRVGDRWKVENGRWIMGITIFVVSFLSITSFAQNTQIKWSSLGSSFGLSNSTNSIITTSAGQSFIGLSSNGNSKVISGFLAYKSSFVTNVEDEQDIIPTVFKLNQNYPNPFNPSTIISWQLPVSSHVSLKVYDILGSEVVTLVDENREGGYYETRFDGSSLASGIYIYRLVAGSFISTKKMLMIK